jgi:hypothetical protein
MLRAAVALQKQKAQCDPQSFSALRQALERKALLLLEAPAPTALNTHFR